MLKKLMNYLQLSKMNFSKYRFNFSSDDEGTFWPGVIELPVEETAENDNPSKFNRNPRVLTAIGLIAVSYTHLTLPTILLV